MSQNMELPNYPRIWLQPFAGDEGSHTWCQDRQSDEDIEYVRADLATPSPQTSPATEGERPTITEDMRYDPFVDQDDYTFAEMRKHPSGDWCKVEDVLRLLNTPPSTKAGEGEPQHSVKLRQGLQAAADSTNSRPPELRGSFKSRTP